MATAVNNPNELPEKPGIYIMKNKYDEVIYIGKSKSLKKRVKSYFKEKQENTKTRVMMNQFKSLEYIITHTEKEALILEATLIKKYRPTYNVRLKDDKRYPYLKITNEKFPQLIITRNIRKDNAKYFGPFTDATAIKKTTKFIKTLFKVRECKHMDGPCLNYQINLCYAPCDNKISEEEYKKFIENIELFFQGKYTTIVKSLEKDMKESSDNNEFEKAAVIRDQIFSIKDVMEKQNVTFSHHNDQDVIAGVYEDKIAYIVVFSIRKGQIVDKDDFIMTNVENNSKENILTAFIEQFYTQYRYIPEEIIVEYPINDEKLITEWLSELKKNKVKIKKPKKGNKLKLIKMAIKNAEIIKNQKKKVESSLIELKKYLKLPRLPKHIEGFDVSNISGKNAVGSMVYFENGKPKKSNYRKFKLNTPGPDDYGMMTELVTRRYTGVIEKKEELPDLIIIDGGKGQLHVAVNILKSLNIDVPIIGLAKKFEEVFIPRQELPIILPRNSQSLYLLQRVRDESHRFAITYHRKLRSKELKKSELDNIKGIGKKRKINMLKKFKNMDSIKKASVEELANVESMNLKSAKEVYKYFSEFYE